MVALLAFLAGTLFLIVSLNAWATFLIVQDTFPSRRQRLSQVLFVWLIPLAGAVLALYLIRQQPEPASGRYHDAPDPGDDFGYSGRNQRQNQEHLPGESSPGEGGGGD